MTLKEIFEGSGEMFETVAGAIAAVPTPLGKVTSKKKKDKYPVIETDKSEK